MSDRFTDAWLRGGTDPFSVAFQEGKNKKPERTELSPLEEPRFRAWAQQSGITDVDQPDSFYDYRGLYREVGGKPLPQTPDRQLPEKYRRQSQQQPPLSRDLSSAAAQRLSRLTSGADLAEVKRRAREGEEILQTGQRAGSAGERAAAHTANVTAGLAENVGGALALGLDTMYQAGGGYALAGLRKLAGQDVGLRDILPATMAVNDAADEIRAGHVFGMDPKLEEIELGGPGFYARTAAEFLPVAPEAMAAKALSGGARSASRNALRAAADRAAAKAAEESALARRVSTDLSNGLVPANENARRLMNPPEPPRISDEAAAELAVRAGTAQDQASAARSAAEQAVEKQLWDEAQAAIKYKGKWYAKGGDQASHSALRQQLGIPDQPNWPGIEDSGWIVRGRTLTLNDLESSKGIADALSRKTSEAEAGGGSALIRRVRGGGSAPPRTPPPPPPLSPAGFGGLPDNGPRLPTTIIRPPTRRGGGSVFDADAYAAEMTARREAARGEPVSKLGPLLSQAKARMVDTYSPIEDTVYSYIRTRGVPAIESTPQSTAKMLLGDTVRQLEGSSLPPDRLLPSRDIRNAIDRSLMSDEIAGQFMKDRGFDSIIRDADNLTTLDQLATAKHAITVFYQRWGRQIDRATPDRLSKLESIYEKRFGRDLMSDAQLVAAKDAEYSPQLDRLNRFSSDLLDYSADAGLISADLASGLRSMYPYYVPLKRVFSVLETSAERGVGAGAASLSRQTAYRKLVGSGRDIESPIESLIQKTYDIHSQGERNKAGRLLASYASWEDNPLQIRELKSGEKAAHTFSFLDGGEKRRFATTPEIAAAAKAMNAEQIGVLGRTLAVPARLLKIGATGLNLPFLAKNLARDLPTAIINSPSGFSIVKDIVKGIYEAIGHGKFYDDIVRQGGMFTSFDQFRLPAKQTVASIRSTRSVSDRAKYIVRNPEELLRAVEDVVARSEQATRLAAASAEYRRAISSGLPHDEAMIAASQASLWTTGPFHRRGDFGRVLQASAPYLNASIQGQRVTLGAFRERPIQTIAKVVATTLMPAAIATAWNLSDDKRRAAYDQHEEFEKENNILIVPPDPKIDPETGLWNTIKIPLPQSVAKWVTLLRRPMEAAADLDRVRVGEMLQALLGTVSPVSSPSEVGANVVPQAVKPPLEVSLNKNFFTRGDIVPRFMTDKPPAEQAFPNSSGTARILGRVTGLSPLEVQHIIRGYGAGVATQGLNLSDRVLLALGVIPAEQVGGEDPLSMTKRGFYGARGISEGRLERRELTRAEEAAEAEAEAEAARRERAVGGGTKVFRTPGDTQQPYENTRLFAGGSMQELLPEQFANARATEFRSFPSGQVPLAPTTGGRFGIDPNLPLAPQWARGAADRPGAFNEVMQIPLVSPRQRGPGATGVDLAPNVIAMGRDADRERVGLHELGHAIDIKDLTPEERGEWAEHFAGVMNAVQTEMRQSGLQSGTLEFQRKLGEVAARYPASIVLNPSALTPEETFAETVAQYMLNPSALKRHSATYNLIRKFFGGREYVQNVQQ